MKLRLTKRSGFRLRSHQDAAIPRRSLPVTGMMRAALAERRMILA